MAIGCILVDLCQNRKTRNGMDDMVGICLKHFFKMLLKKRASLIAQLVKNPPAMQETLVQFLGRENLLEKG